MVLGFVCGKKLNALSQYCHDCYFPVLVEKQQQLCDHIRKYWRENAPLAPFEDAIVDFAVMADGESVCIVEVNPFVRYSQMIGCFVHCNIHHRPQDVYTGPGLFDWDKDWTVLTNGPFELRIVSSEEMVSEAQEMAMIGWACEIEDAVEQVRKERRESRAQRRKRLAVLGVALGLVVAGACVWWW